MNEEARGLYEPSQKMIEAALIQPQTLPADVAGLVERLKRVGRYSEYGSSEREVCFDAASAITAIQAERDRLKEDLAEQEANGFNHDHRQACIQVALETRATTAEAALAAAQEENERLRERLANSMQIAGGVGPHSTMSATYHDPAALLSTEEAGT